MKLIENQIVKKFSYLVKKKKKEAYTDIVFLRGKIWMGYNIPKVKFIHNSQKKKKGKMVVINDDEPTTTTTKQL